MSRSRSEDGFTLIELIVVVAIIGILAAVALPAFLGQKKGAGDAKAKADLANAVHALEVYRTEHDSYGATPADLVGLEAALTGALNLQISGTATTYVISADSKRGGRFFLEKTGTSVVRTCLPVGVGGCDANGQW